MKFVKFFTYLLGFGLPILETYRRGFSHWTVHTMTMAGDYIMGILLLIAAFSIVLKKSYGYILLLVAWAYVLGVMNAAFWGHLEGSIRGVTLCDNPPEETRAIVVKGIMWFIALISVIITAKKVYRDQIS